jgi:hypothetical protein
MNGVEHKGHRARISLRKLLSRPPYDIAEPESWLNSLVIVPPKIMEENLQGHEIADKAGRVGLY